MPFCTQCGASNPDIARFCDQCGAPLIHVSAPAQPPPPLAPSPAVLETPPAVVSDSCPQCGASVIPGEAFCDNCGAQLFTMQPSDAREAAVPALLSGGVPPQTSYPSPKRLEIGESMGTDALPVVPAQTRPPGAPATPAVPQAPVPAAAPSAGLVRRTLAPGQLVVVGGSGVVPLPATSQAVLGRGDPISNFFPDIDLQLHGAMELGVGRRHLMLLVQNNQVFAEDLDSTNGSFLNRQRLLPRKPQPVQNGDELRLGNLVLSIQL